ncbi:MAG: stability/partitioning determinant [Alphaproteobacteria bacterium]|nr:stability/partitioning determinant [Alphaproteobacteria bacterium]
MGTERADLGFSEALDDFNPAEWVPQKKQSNDRQTKEVALKAAKAAGFKSREAAAPKGQGTELPRRRRTGRNAQFNLKAKPETIEAYCTIADRQGWGLGETLERAVELLGREYDRQP